MKKAMLNLMVLLLLALPALGGCDGTGGPGHAGGDLGDLPPIDLEGNTKVKILGSVTEELKTQAKNTYGLELEELTVPWEDVPVRLATLVLSGDSPDICMFRSDGMDFPNFIVNNLVQPVNDYIDLNNSFYDSVRECYELTQWQDKNYLMATGLGTSSSMFYNKKLFEDAGLETPWELYKKNEWDWNKLREYALALTEDKDNDGIPNRYGFAMCRPHGFLYTTGKALGSYDSKTLSAINNVTDPDFARAQNFLSDMILKDHVCPTSITDTLDYFATDAVAMVYAQLFYEDANVVNLAKEGKLGICPLPRDPNVDKYYARGEIGGLWMPDGAKNPKGAVAYYNLILRQSRDTSNQEKEYERYRTEYGYTEENIEQVKENADVTKVVPVLELTPWMDGGATWHMILNGGTWDVELAKVMPTIEAKIAEVFKPLEVDIATSPKKVDDFEGYGTDTGKHLSPYVVATAGGPNFKMTLDTANAQSPGQYAAKVAYDVSEATWGGVELAVNKTWETNNALRFWMKGDGSEQTISLQFTTLNGGVFVHEFKLTGSEGKVYEIPFSSFTRPEGNTAELNLATVSKFCIYVADETPGEQVFYIDNIEVFSK